MSIPNETLKAMIRDYNGIELSDEELELVRPELESYFAELKKLEDLDLSDVFSCTFRNSCCRAKFSDCLFLKTHPERSRSCLTPICCG